ncbi:tRNA lysidine(34) synthetase TilS [Ideonella sp. A 288]|uniref:tRNA lysidine(34) synthetase TilS n=1 Tax=Ideonella sp. A 288 TaxID=1962181 RepID=UPI001F27B0A9|nr:tRNA lysidine(34) synthetase TilS [Ideonella sp. A 288]
MSADGHATLGATVGVAFSGGRDSLALLHATVRSAVSLGLDVVALHVHHGLVDRADEWVASAIRLCARWQRRGWPVRLRWHRLTDRPSPGDSVEAWARRERYAALATMATEEGARLVLLAHHRRDQAETVLLQALRGAGPRGLAAMPKVVARAGLTWARPWLDLPRDAIDAYVRQHRLRPIEDPSNDDTRLARNLMRRSVWPAMAGAFGTAEAALAAVARRAHEADAALSELAQLDLAATGTGDRLDVVAWSALSPARRANALRVWLEAGLDRGAPDTLVQRLLDELPGRTSGRWPASAHSALVLHRKGLTWTDDVPAQTGPCVAIDLSGTPPIEVLSWGGRFEAHRVEQGGIALEHLSALELRPRRGGEQFQCAPRATARSLKKQYQSAGVAAHQRSGPLVWHGDRLVYVPGLGMDARCWAPAGTPQVALAWRPDRA